MVYLIHFDKPYKHALHYIGFTKLGLEKRIEKHGTSQGAKLLLVLKQNAIGFKVVRTWSEGTRTFERKLKNRKNAKKICPICSPERATQRGNT